MELERLEVCMPIVRDEAGAPEAAFYFWDGSRPIRDDWLRPIILAWEDGRLIWSRDTLTPGPPYYTGSVTPDRVQQMLSDLEVHGAFGDPVRFWQRYPFDSSHFDIAIAAGSRRLHMGSWGRNPAQVHEPEEERRFCELWYTLENALLDLRPATCRDAGDIAFEVDWLPPDERQLFF